MLFTGSRDGKADKMQRQLVRNKDGKIQWNQILKTNIQRKARPSQCISQSMDWAEGGSEPTKINLFIGYNNPQ